MRNVNKTRLSLVEKENVMEFKEGDIIKWCDGYYLVISNYGNSGEVIQCNKNGRPIDTVSLNNFYWNYGEASKLFKRAW